jgi:hypothetical protein
MEKRYQLIFSRTSRTGKCIDCAQDASVEFRAYFDRETKKQVTVEVRSICQRERYQQERDPYAGK